MFAPLSGRADCFPWSTRKRRPASSNSRRRCSGSGAEGMVNVICMKWGARYSPEYVNRLHHMVRRRLSRAHRFVCFTDDGTGIEPGVEVKPLPKIGFEVRPGRFWNKLGIFARPLADLEGPVLWIDLDVVIVR